MVSDGLNKYVVTAGHFRSDISTNYYQGTTYLGQMPHKTQGGYADAGMIGGGPSSVTYQGGKIYLDGSATTGRYIMTQNASEDVVGEDVFMSGASTDTNPVQWGTIQSTSYSTTLGGYSYSKLRTANFTSAWETGGYNVLTCQLTLLFTLYQVCREGSVGFSTFFISLHCLLFRATCNIESASTSKSYRRASFGFLPLGNGQYWAFIREGSHIQV